MSEISRLWLDQLEQKMREGKVSDVRNQLRAVNIARVPRPQVLALANLARRVGLVSRALRLLNPIVRPKNNLLKKYTPQESAEYAVCLTRIGALTEARNLLAQIPEDKEPRVLLYRAFALFPEWNYEDAIFPLEQFIAMNFSDPYQTLIAKVNLIASYVVTQHFQKAEKTLADALQQVKEKKLGLLHGNLLELSAQLYIGQKKNSKALNSLEEASSLLSGHNTAESLYIEKWRAVLETENNKSEQKQCQALKKVRQKAVEMEHWETVRDCDFHICRLSKDRRTFHFLYHGSPFEKYRERLTRDVPEMLVPQTKYRWLLGSRFAEMTARGKERIAESFDVELGQSPDGQIRLKPGQMLHSVLYSLTRDFYRPLRLGHLFFALFPGEYFSPETSPDRIHQVLRRFRMWCHSNLADVQLHESKGNYWLTARQPLVLLVSQKSTGEASTLPLELRGLKERMGAKPFQAKKMAQDLGVSLSTATRLIREGKTLGIIEQIGSGRSTQFVFKAKE